MDNKKPVFKRVGAFILAAAAPGILAVSGALFRLVPEAVIYGEPESKNILQQTFVKETAAKQSALYENILDIPVENYLSYRICADNKNIYVSSQSGEILYTVKAHIDEFPEGDKELLLQGMEVSGRQLYEVISYLES